MTQTPDSKPTKALDVKDDQVVSWTPTDEDLLKAVRRGLQLTPSSDFAFHSVKVTDREAQCQVFIGSNNFMTHVSQELKTESGQPTKLFLFFGWRLHFSTPQIVVGLNTSGQKRQKPIYIQKQNPNPGGDVPDFSLASG